MPPLAAKKLFSIPRRASRANRTSGSAAAAQVRFALRVRNRAESPGDDCFRFLVDDPAQFDLLFRG
jgi:hypothetical protein